MAKPRVHGLQRLWYAVGYSLAGLRAAFTYEEAFRTEVALALLLVPLGLWLGTNSVEKLMLAASVLLVLVVELLNTAIESVVDRVGAEPHELSGRAKDIGSAAVLLSLLGAGMTWVLLLWPMR